VLPAAFGRRQVLFAPPVGFVDGGNLRISDEKTAAGVETEGKLVRLAGDNEQLLLDFDAADCVAHASGRSTRHAGFTWDATA